MTHDGDFFHYLLTLFPSTENSEPSDDLEHAIQLGFSPQEYAFGLSATEIDAEDADDDMVDFLMTDLMTDLERAFSFPEPHDLDYKDEGTLSAEDNYDSGVSLLAPAIPDQIVKASLCSPVARKTQAGTERNDSDDDTIDKDDFCDDYHEDDRSSISAHNPSEIRRPSLYSAIEKEQTQNDTDEETSVQQSPEHKQPRPTKKRPWNCTCVLLTPFGTPTLTQPIVVARNALALPSAELPLSAASTSFYSPALLQSIAITSKPVELVNSAHTDGRLPLAPAFARLNTNAPAIMATKRGLEKEQENTPNYKKQRKAY